MVSSANNVNNLGPDTGPCGSPDDCFDLLLPIYINCWLFLKQKGQI